MSYDIITKGHGRELNVETKEGEGTAFTLLLPKIHNLLPLTQNTILPNSIKIKK